MISPFFNPNKRHGINPNAATGNPVAASDVVECAANCDAASDVVECAANCDAVLFNAYTAYLNDISD